MINGFLRQIRGKYALNPIWEVELRRLQGGLQLLQRFGVRALSAAIAAALGISAFTGIQWQLLGQLHLNIVGWSILGAIGLMLAADVAHVFTTVTHLGAEMRSGQWDLLRLTALKPQAILDAKYNSAQLRTWRILMLEISLRLFTTLLIGVPTLFVTITDILRFTNFVDSNLLMICFVLFVQLGIAVIYVREPWWRMRAIVAVSLAISASVRQEGYAVLAALGMLLAIRIIQVALVIGIPLFVMLIGRDTFGFAMLCLIPYMVALLYGTTFWFYNFLRVNMLRFALRYAFRSE
ncbi:MAG: hypothetical protein DYG88_15510 [Chloroflexi bacterium CFX4]|nr:hypothetical protein [Chloroflexi bacterium CFX4]MDL1924178.1 hypothetical protein [Chloroflexi bacterium CFX3]